MDKKLYGWFSPEMEKIFGSMIYLTPDGKKVTVTYITFDKNNPYSNSKVTVTFMGEVKELLRSLSKTYFQEKNKENQLLLSKSGYSFYTQSNNCETNSQESKEEETLSIIQLIKRFFSHSFLFTRT